MSKPLPNIDDLFKMAIDKHEDAPSQKVWEAIDKNLDKKKVVSISRKYNKLKWAAAAILLFSFGMAMYTWHTQLKNKELVKQNNINREVRTNKKFKDPAKTAENKNVPGNIDTITNNNQSITLSETKPITNTESDKKTIAENKNIDNSLAKDPNSDFLFPKSQELQKQGKNESTKPQQTSNGIFNFENENTKDVKEKNNSSEKNVQQVPLIVNSIPFLNDLFKIEKANPFLYKPDDLLNNKKIETEKNQNPISKISASKATKNSLFSATVFFSPEFVASDVKDDHPRFREDDRHEIKNNEKVNSSNSYGVLFDRSLGKKLSVETGASIFTRITDINTKTVFARPDDRGDVNFRLNCSAGAAFIPLKSGVNPTQGDSAKILSAKNTLQYISIPLAIKYKLGKGKLTFNPGVGISANILSKSKVETVLATAGGNESNTSNNIEGLKSHYFNGQISLGAEYLLSNKIGINFSPAAKIALSSINKDAPVKTKLNAFALAAGIVFKF